MSGLGCSPRRSQAHPGPGNWPRWPSGGARPPGRGDVARPAGGEGGHQPLQSGRPRWPRRGESVGLRGRYASVGLPPKASGSAALASRTAVAAFRRRLRSCSCWRTRSPCYVSPSSGITASSATVNARCHSSFASSFTKSLHRYRPECWNGIGAVLNAKVPTKLAP